LDSILAAVNRCCKTEAECGQCLKGGCLVGFARLAVEYARQKNTARVPGAAQLMPDAATRLYYEEDLVSALVEVLLQCQNCLDNHEAECVVNVVREALELALLGDTQSYEGSAAGYLVNVAKTNPRLGERLLASYRQRRAAPA
jgi:hypothetical protein